MSTLSHHLQAWRAARGLSQTELARRSDLARPNLIDLELGRRDCTVGTLIKLAVALDLTPGKLLDTLPVAKANRLDRFARDAIARAIITGTPPSLKHARAVADLAPLFQPALEAAGLQTAAKRRIFVRRRKYRLETLYSPEFVGDVTERIRRLLPSFAKQGGS